MPATAMESPSLLHRWDGCSALFSGALGRCSQWLGQQLGLMKVRPFPRGAPHCGTGVTFLTHGEIKGCWTLERPGGIEPALCTLEGCCPTTRPRSLSLAEAQGIEPSPIRMGGDEFQIRLPTFGACFLMCRWWPVACPACGIRWRTFSQLPSLLFPHDLPLRLRIATALSPSRRWTEPLRPSALGASVCSRSRTVFNPPA